MSKTAHSIFIGILVAFGSVVFIALLIRGLPYYRISLEERFYHPDHAILKSSGILGHGLGIIGSLLIIFGMGFYMARKRYRFLSRMGILKHWLEVHIFMCTLGPMMVLFHTAYKFGGIVAVSFWSMVAVFLSGIIGRFIYIQIPHSIEGRELSLGEVRDLKSGVAGMVRDSNILDEESYYAIVESTKRKFEIVHKNPIRRFFQSYRDDRRSVQAVKISLRRNNLPKTSYKKILGLVKEDIKLNRRIERLDTMRNLFKYWHVVHMPFALVMLIIMLIHVAVTILFGYRWIF